MTGLAGGGVTGACSRLDPFMQLETENSKLKYQVTAVCYSMLQQQRTRPHMSASPSCRCVLCRLACCCLHALLSHAVMRYVIPTPCCVQVLHLKRAVVESDEKLAALQKQ